MDSPPAAEATYQILDIRSSDGVGIELPVQKKERNVPVATRGHEHEASGDKKPPTPPPSTDQSLDAFDSEDLADTIIKSLEKPLNCKSIPTFILYDKRGLQLFDQITHLNEYYLTGAEMKILAKHADQIADRLQDGSALIELGAG